MSKKKSQIENIKKKLRQRQTKNQLSESKVVEKKKK